MKPLEILKEHCKFESLHDVYVLLAVARKKDHEDITNSQEIVFREIIRKEQDIERKYNKIDALTKNYLDGKYSFYVYVTSNPRDVRKAYFQLSGMMMSSFSEFMYGVDLEIVMKKFKRIDGLWISALMKNTCRGSSKNFVVDLDEPENLQQTCDELEKYTEILRTVKTKNGYHILVKPFNRKLIDTEIIKKDDIQTDAVMFIDYVARNKK